MISNPHTRPRLALLVAGVVTALAAPVAPAAAQTLADYDYENLAFRGAGVSLGYIWPDKVEDTEAYSVRLDLGYLGPGVRIMPSITYWSSRLTDEELERLAGQLSDRGIFATPDALGPIEWSDLSLSLDGHFVWTTPINVLTYVGAGASLHALNGQGEAIDDTFIEDLLDSITAGVGALAGIEFQPVSRFRVFAEGRYTALNSFQYLSARGGVMMMFPARAEGIEVGAVAAPRLRADVKAGPGSRVGGASHRAVEAIEGGGR